MYAQSEMELLSDLKTKPMAEYKSHPNAPLRGLIKQGLAEPSKWNDGGRVVGLTWTGRAALERSEG
ncbi:hypothetical protein ASF69_04380 [Rhizobium sp. Leaf311]|nr:hypothetical protein ASF69_04380 [Rhizobium sp. Leaf311]